MNRSSMLVAAALSAVSLAGCLTTTASKAPSSWDYFTGCSEQSITNGMYKDISIRMPHSTFVMAYFYTA